MTAINGHEYYQTCIEKLDDDEDDGNGFTQTDTSNLNAEDDIAGGDVDSDKSTNIDEYGQTSPAFRRKTKSEYEENDVKSVDTAISSEISNEEKIHEFDDADYESNVTKRGKGTAANKPALFKCMICSYRTNKKCNLSQHLPTHSDERPFNCDLCGKYFKRSSGLRRHQNIHLGQKPHACSNCDMAFGTLGELIRHERYRHTRIKPHKCTECDYSSVELSGLRRHMRSHTGERPYQCPHCSYSSASNLPLRRHMRIHHGKKPYECDICHARFWHSRSLKYHRLKHPAAGKHGFHCHLCPTTCIGKWLLRLHIKKLHSSDQPIPCKRCGKELPDRYSYKMHIKTHESEKFYRCEYCPYAAASPSLLKLHVIIHFDVKPFTCEICENNFRKKHQLTHHMKTYHPDNYKPPEKRKRDSKCPHCEKSYTLHGSLMRHMKIHDPTSLLDKEKHILKIGRLKRVKPDATAIIASKSLSGDNEELRNKEAEEQQGQDEKLKAEYEDIEEYSEDNLQNIYDEYEADEYEEQPKNVQNVEQSDETNEKKTLIIDIKPEEIQEMDIAQTSFKKSIISSKAEDKKDSEIKIEIHDDQGFMVVKVTPDDGGDEEK